DSPSYTNRSIYLTRPILVWTSMGNASSINRERILSERHNITYAAINYKSTEAFFLRKTQHNLSCYSIGHISCCIHDDDITLLSHVDRLMNHQIITGTCSYSNRWADKLPLFMVRLKISVHRKHTVQIITDMRCNHRFIFIDQML